MIANLFQQGAKTDEEYRGKLKNRIKINAALSLLGLITIVVGIFYMSRGEDMRSGFLCGLFVGTGLAIVFYGLKEVLKIRKLLKSEKRLREERLKVNDERNKMIGEKSLSWAGVVTMVLCYFGILISGFFDMVVFWTIWTIVMSYSILAVILKRYLDKKL